MQAAINSSARRLAFCADERVASTQRRGLLDLRGRQGAAGCMSHPCGLNQKHDKSGPPVAALALIQIKEVGIAPKANDNSYNVPRRSDSRGGRKFRVTETDSIQKGKKWAIGHSLRDEKAVQGTNRTLKLRLFVWG
jgi:hypothetical protein